MLMWRRKTKGELVEGWVLSSEDHSGSDTLAGLLSRHADAVMAHAASPQSHSSSFAIEKVFRALVDQTADGQAIRRRASFEELCAVTGMAPEQLNALLRPFRAEGASSSGRMATNR